MPAGEKAGALRVLNDSQVVGCTKCRLAETRTQTVFGEGDANAKLMFIGEGPGADEDASGRPFVGRAGQKLTDMIKGMGLSREQVFIANIVKCRPPANRVPLEDEVDACTPYLIRQIEIIRPKVIITLGAPFNHHPRANNADRLYRLVNGGDTGIDWDGFERRRVPPPVPCTAIYSKSDGIVHWRCSLEEPAPHTENVEVSGSHLGLGVNVGQVDLDARRGRVVVAAQLIGERAFDEHREVRVICRNPARGERARHTGPCRRTDFAGWPAERSQVLESRDEERLASAVLA